MDYNIIKIKQKTLSQTSVDDGKLFQMRKVNCFQKKKKIINIFFLLCELWSHTKHTQTYNKMKTHTHTHTHIQIKKKVSNS